MSPLSNPAGQLAAARLAVGVSSWLAPKLVMRAFSVDPDANPGGGYLLRLFGIRDAILGLCVLTSSGEEQKRWLQAGLVCDLADIAAAGVSAKEGGLPTAAAVLGGAAAVGGVTMGVLALRGS